MTRDHIRNISVHMLSSRDLNNLRHEMKDGKELLEEERLLETLLSEDVSSSVILTVDSGEREMRLPTTANYSELQRSQHR